MTTRSEDQPEPQGPRNDYRLKLIVEKLMSATRLRVHPDREEEIREMLSSIAQYVPELMKPGRVVVEARLAPGQVLVETMPVLDEDVEDAPDA